MSGRDELVNLLDREVFRPIIDKSADSCSGNDGAVSSPLRRP